MEKIFVIGGCDSIGVPYSRDNKDNIGFFELLIKRLEKDYAVENFNFFSMAKYNTSDYIYNVLTENCSLKLLKQRQIESLKICKNSGIFPFLELPKKFLDHYKQIKSDDKILTKLSDEKTIFIYSSGINDFLKCNNLSLFKLLFPKGLKTVKNNLDRYIEKSLTKLERNLELLNKINPKMKVYIIGCFIPTNLQYIRKSLSLVIIDYNEKIKKLLNSYPNITFIDNSNLFPGDFNNIDFHPNKKGHLKIYQNLINKMYL